MASSASRTASLALLGVQPLLFYFRVLFNPRRHIPYDILAFHLPLTAYIARCAREHIWPLWDPYTYCGMPIHADLQAQLFYPPVWISILIGNLSAGRNLYYWLEWQIPLHMILAGLCTFFLLRYLGLEIVPAFFGATVYQLGGYFASQAQHVGAICCAAWLPLVLLCIFRLSREARLNWTVLLAAALALCILAGFMAATLVVFIAAGLIGLILVFSARPTWKFVAALLCAAMLALGLTAIQLIPTYQLTRMSVASDRVQALSTGGGLRIQSLVSLIAPNYYHIFTPFDPSKYKLGINFTYLYVYCGLITVILIAAAPFLRSAPYTRLFFSLTIVSAVWMLGDQTPVYGLVFRHLPALLRGALYSEYALATFSLFAALTAAAAFNHLERGWPGWLLWGVALVTTADLCYFGANRPMNSLPGSYREETNEYQVFGAPGALEQLQQLGGATNPPLRIDYLGWKVFRGITGAAMLKLPTADGDNPFALKRVIAIRRLFCGGYWWERDLPVNRPNSPLLGALNIGFLAGRDGQPLPKGLELWSMALQAAGLRIYRNPRTLPRFFLVSRLHAVRNEKEAVAYLARADFDPAQEAVIETVSPIANEPLSPGVVQVLDYSPNRVELQVTTAGRAFLASSEALYPGWTATVNGMAVQFHMTNGAFRGLFLNQGTNRIVMLFRPTSLRVGAIISVVSVVLLGMALVASAFHFADDNDRNPKVA